jgi:predicted 3-demethylubiquinone-9 3-methyltransferase (glyoxalase superfamily)
VAAAKIQPVRMFQGKAELAMNFYVSLFAGAERSVMKASFRIGTQTILCTDSTGGRLQN